MRDLPILFRRYRLIIWPFVSGLASLVILVSVIIPQFLAYIHTQGEIAKTQDNLTSLEAKAAELEDFDEAVARRDLQVAFSVLPISQDVPTSLTILQDLVRKSGLELKNTNYASTRQVGGKESYQLQVTVNGPVTAIRDFLLRLEDSPQIFRVESINVHFLKTLAAAEADLPITIFYEAASPVSGDVNKPLPKLSDKERELLNHYSALTQAVQPVTVTTPEVAPDVPLGKLDPFQ